MRSLVLCTLLLAALLACTWSAPVSAVRLAALHRARAAAVTAAAPAAPVVQEPVTSLEGRVLPPHLVAKVFDAQQALQTDLPVKPDYTPLGSGKLAAASAEPPKPVVSPAVQVTEAILASPAAQKLLADQSYAANVAKIQSLPAGATKPAVWQSADGSIYRLDSKGFPILDDPQSGITNAALRMIKEDQENKANWAAEDAARKASYAAYMTAQEAAQAAAQRQQAALQLQQQQAAFQQAKAIALAQQQAAAAAKASAAAAAAAAATKAGAAGAAVKPVVPAGVVPVPTNTGIVGSFVKTMQDARAAWQQFKGNVAGIGQAVKAAVEQPIHLSADLEASLPGLSARLSKQMNIQLLELPRIEEGTVEAPMTFAFAEVDADAEADEEADADLEDQMTEEEMAQMEIDADAEALAELDSEVDAEAQTEVDADAEAQAELEASEDEQLNASSDPSLIFAASRHFRRAPAEAAPAEDHPSLAGFAEQPDPARVDIKAVNGINVGFHNPQNQAQVWAVEKQ